MRRRIGRVRNRLAVLAAVCALAFGATGGTAQATAGGWQYWGNFSWNGVRFPSGSLYHEVRGSGPRLTGDVASFASVGSVCDFWIDFDYYARGQRYFHVQGAEQRRCARSYATGWRPQGGSRIMRTGQGCATLYAWTPSRVATIARQCHHIQ
ncbi:hypothetical protein ACGFNQ_02080 [Streptomyces asoensis]|uniref:hypothetical protein n=1 Tax=Streptomyces asoensis TaxID=249586 RepID=UPI00371A9C05